jgi:transcriptional regulator with XRE-family HTH domain
VAKGAEQRVLREVGLLIRAAREGAGLSQEDAAHRAGIDAKRWQRLEYGDVNPTVRTLVRVASALRIDFWALLNDEIRAGDTVSEQGSPVLALAESTPVVQREKMSKRRRRTPISRR